MTCARRPSKPTQNSLMSLEMAPTMQRSTPSVTQQAAWTVLHPLFVEKHNTVVSVRIVKKEFCDKNELASLDSRPFEKNKGVNVDHRTACWMVFIRTAKFGTVDAKNGNNGCAWSHDVPLYERCGIYSGGDSKHFHQEFEYGT